MYLSTKTTKKCAKERQHLSVFQRKGMDMITVINVLTNDINNVFPPNIAPPSIAAPSLFGTEKYIITYLNSTFFSLKTFFGQ